MQRRWRGLAGVLIGGTVGGLLSTLMPGRRVSKNRFPDPHMPAELLLTFTSGSGTPRASERPVQELLGQVQGSTRVALTPLPRGDAAHADQPLMVQPPLTLCTTLPSPVNAGSVQVKRLADRINGLRADLQHSGVSLSSAMPNWLTSSSVLNSGGGHSGPGTLPAPAPGGDWQIAVPAAGAWPPEGVAAHLDLLADQGVTVAVLDTWPGWDAVRAAAERHSANPLLAFLASGQTISEWHPVAQPARQTPHLTRAGADLWPGPMNMADHGLFVCSIIHRVAPHARIEILPVLDAQGSGHTDLLLQGLDHCLHLAQRGRRLVVNLSMYLLIPPDDILWRTWFVQADDATPKDPAARAELLDALDEAIEQRITLLLDAGAVVVAAAGNDYFLYKKRTQPRLPADYDTVLCVVAADRDGRIANYSNRADVPFTGNGVATYGGQGVRSTRKGGVQAVEVPDGPPDDRDAVVGLYTRFDQVGPHQGPDESSGWAYWSGTSFATPIISGIAANLLAANQLARRNGSPEPLLTPRGVMGRILAMAAPTGDREMGCPYLHVAQRRFITS